MLSISACVLSRNDGVINAKHAIAENVLSAAPALLNPGGLRRPVSRALEKGILAMNITIDRFALHGSPYSKIVAFGAHDLYLRGGL